MKWLKPFFVTLFLFPLPAAAQMPTFQEKVVVTASGDEESLEQVPAAVTLVGEEELARSLETSLAALLRRVPGVTVLRSGLDGGVTSLFSRGTNSSHTLVLFEGIRLNDPYFGGYDWSLPFTAGIGRVEVVRGPYSALYGSEALGGVVQLFAPRGQGFRTQFLAEAGSGGWRRLQGQVGVGSTSWDLHLAAVEREGTGVLANDSFWGKAFTLRGQWRPSSALHLGLLARLSRSHTEVPFSGATWTPHRFTAAEETLVGLPLEVQLTKGLVLAANLARVEGQLTFRDPDDPWGYTAADTQKASWQGRAVLKGSWAGHRWQLGGEWRRDQVTAGSSLGPALANRRQQVRALFLQDRASLGAGGEVTLGLRYDRAGSWEELSPRLVWQKLWAQTRLWVSLGKGFRAPSLGELYYPYSGNPHLQPERAQSLEVGLGRVLAGGWVGQVVPFANRVSNLVDFDYATWRFANVAKARQKGVEFSLERQRPTSFLRWAVTWLAAKDGQGQDLLRRPRWGGSFTWGKQTAWGEGEWSLVYVGRRWDVDPVSFARVPQGGFVTANAALRWRLLPELFATLRVENLADKAYQEVRGYPAPGRRAFLGLELASR
jgi:vitamin B12 transporter